MTQKKKKKKKKRLLSQGPRTERRWGGTADEERLVANLITCILVED